MRRVSLKQIHEESVARAWDITEVLDEYRVPWELFPLPHWVLMSDTPPLVPPYNRLVYASPASGLVFGSVIGYGNLR